jgi:hypothetical protein
LNTKGLRGPGVLEKPNVNFIDALWRAILGRHLGKNKLHQNVNANDE